MTFELDNALDLWHYYLTPGGNGRRQPGGTEDTMANHRNRRNRRNRPTAVAVIHGGRAEVPCECWACTPKADHMADHGDQGCGPETCGYGNCAGHGLPAHPATATVLRQHGQHTVVVRWEGCDPYRVASIHPRHHRDANGTCQRCAWLDPPTPYCTPRRCEAVAVAAAAICD